MDRAIQRRRILASACGGRRWTQTVIFSNRAVVVLLHAIGLHFTLFGCLPRMLGGTRKIRRRPLTFPFHVHFFTLLYQDQNSPIQDHTSTITLDASTITAYQKWLNSQKKLGADFTNQLPGYNNYQIFQH